VNVLFKDSSPYQKYDLKDVTVTVDNSASHCIALKLADLQMGSMLRHFSFVICSHPGLQGADEMQCGKPFLGLFAQRFMCVGKNIVLFGNLHFALMIGFYFVCLFPEISIIISFYFCIFPALKLSFESDDEQLSWLKQFERSGVKTGETEEVTMMTTFFYRVMDSSSFPSLFPQLGQLTAMTCTLTSIPYSLHIFGNFCISLVIYICRSSVKVYKLKTVSI
jgi:hypothetical protein